MRTCYWDPNDQDWVYQGYHFQEHCNFPFGVRCAKIDLHAEIIFVGERLNTKHLTLDRFIRSWIFAHRYQKPIKARIRKQRIRQFLKGY